jgi:TrmH family RNA methyltransferase
MVSKNQIKLITALQQKKFRKEHGLFFAEGIKVVGELLDSGLVLHSLYTTGAYSNEVLPEKVFEATEAEMKKISALSTPAGVLAVFRVPKPVPVSYSGLIMALDGISDPGNMGTLIRLCDWFGIRHLVCSHNCVDVLNPKVVQATMGSLTRVNIVYEDLDLFLQDSPLPIFGTFMDGENIYKEQLPAEGIIVMGNEANGISPDVEQMVSGRLAIPRFGALQATESLNVATAAAIILSEFCRGA